MMKFESGNSAGYEVEGKVMLSVKGKWEGGRKCKRLKFGLAVEVKDTQKGCWGTLGTSLQLYHSKDGVIFLQQ